LSLGNSPRTEQQSQIHKKEIAMNEPTTLAELQKSSAVAQRQSSQVSMSFFNMDGFELMQRIAKAFAASDLVPKQYQGNLPNCMIALDMAQRIGANPLQVMQNLYVVHGTPGWSSKFLIATVNTCGRFSTMRYEWKGEPGEEGFGCRAWAIEKATGERLDGIWVTWKMVNAEGWANKNGSKWRTMEDQMFIYRAASFWQRAYAPELGMGLQTEEELQDVYDARKDSGGAYAVDLDDLRNREPAAPAIIEQDENEKPLDEESGSDNTAHTNEEVRVEEPIDANNSADEFGAME
jgi:hypothetical protein